MSPRDRGACTGFARVRGGLPSTTTCLSEVTGRAGSMFSTFSGASQSAARGPAFPSKTMARLRPAPVSFPRYLPMFDPDHFADVGFFEELASIGYRQVLLGGTGSAALQVVSAQIRAQTELNVVLYPGGPGGVADADVVVLPDVMNSNSHFARPFGSGPVSTAMAVAERGLPFVPVAYFIMATSTASWFYDASPPPSTKVLLGCARYAAMLGYQHVALDYEGDGRCELSLIRRLAEIEGLRVLVSDAFSAARAKEALQAGASTVVTPSNCFERHADPLAHAAALYDELLR